MNVRKYGSMLCRSTACAFAALAVSCALEPPQDSSSSDGDLDRQGSAIGCPTSGSSPFQGRRLCETIERTVNWNPAGQARLEDFAVGTDCALWHSWQDSNFVWHQWQSLGGCLLNESGPLFSGGFLNVDIETLVPTGNRKLTVVGIGTDQQYWCLDWPWANPWHRC